MMGGKVVETGWYIVENQYHQTGNAYWDGEKWTDVSFVNGSCMKYGDEKIVSWNPIKQKSKKEMLKDIRIQYDILNIESNFVDYDYRTRVLVLKMCEYLLMESENELD